LHQSNLVSNLLLVYATQRLLPLLKSISRGWTRDHLYGLTGYKGTIAAQLLFKDNSYIVFMTSHFFPGEKFFADRIKQYAKSSRCAFEHNPSGRRFLLWMGDFNSRTEGFTNSADMVKILGDEDENGLCELVRKYDQLKKSVDGKKAFVDYAEERVTFKPTYRVMHGSGAYDERRIPSWCDRVLYKGDLKADHYSSYSKLALSDHFPVTFVGSAEAPSLDEKAESDVQFEHIPTWSDSIPLFCRFTYRNKFWSSQGSYRDWVAIYPANIQSIPSPTQWINISATYEDYNKRMVAEFPPLRAGNYRAAYFSHKNACLIGISETFSVKNFHEK